MNKEKSILSKRINQMRKELDLTQEELAKKLGLNNKSSIANYESGYSIPSDDIKLKMCEIFNCSMDYLMGKNYYKNYEEFAKLDEFVLSYALNQTEKDSTLIANTLNYINTHKDENAEKIINDAVKDLPTNSQNILKTVISHLHYRYNGKIPNKADLIDKYSNSFNKKTQLLEDYINKDNIDEMFPIPVLGKITAGQPILAEEHLEGYLPVDPNIYGMTTADDYFYLKVSGESMNLKVHNGDYALIHKQDYAENGDIIVAIVNGDDEATLKKYKKLNEQFILLEPMSTDPTIEMITIDLRQSKFKIIGKAIGQFGKF